MPATSFAGFAVVDLETTGLFPGGSDRVVEIGLGASSGREPARWQEAVAWWERVGKSLAKPPAMPPAIPGPTFATGTAPLQTGAPAEPSIG